MPLVFAADAPLAGTPPAGPGTDSIAASSYALGLTFGGQLHHGGIKYGLSMDALMHGIQDGLQGKVPSQDDKQRATLLLRSAHDAAGEKNKSIAYQFLTKNAKAVGVTTTASGLEYKVLVAGDVNALPARATDEVSVQYRGHLLDGTEFDSSYAHGKAASFRVNGVIKGWQEALSLMKPGAKWQLFIPPELAYENSPPPNIPPDSLLIFDMELLKIQPAAAASAVATAAGGVPAPKPHHHVPTSRAASTSPTP